MPMPLLAGPALLALAVLLTPLQALAQADLNLGRMIYRSRAECSACHGWAANGRKDDQMMEDGANLHETALNREQLIEIVKCGRPGTGMPHFDLRAYTDRRCYGMTAAEVGQEKPNPGGVNLSQREMEAVADFLLARVVGKPVSYEWCLDYLAGGDTNACNEFRK